MRLQQNCNILSINTDTQGGHTMFKSIFKFIQALRYAGHAATLSRNGKYKEAQAMYKD